jgi:WhiB family transcriptional regulator, redox-sensing transcriptional regulator
MSMATTHDGPAAPEGAAGAARPVPVLDNRDPWQEAAACSDADTELFFPVGKGMLAAAEARQAKQICARCPVQPQCLRYALATGQEFGIWGGYDEDERRPLHLAWRASRGIPRQSGPDDGHRQKETQSWYR